MWGRHNAYWTAIEDGDLQRNFDGIRKTAGLKSQNPIPMAEQIALLAWMHGRGASAVYKRLLHLNNDRYLEEVKHLF